jgi:hypothetical protein
MSHPKTQQPSNLANLEESPKANGSAKPPQRTERKAEGRKCSVPNCGKKHHIRGYCARHYREAKRKGEFGLCEFPDCGRGIWSRTWCQAHYIQQKAGMSLVPVRLGKTGENNPKWRGGEMNDGHGRVLIYSPSHPYPNFGKKYVYRYRLVVEQSIGRYLLPAELVHHKNGDPTDDRIENLEITTRPDHIRHHHKDMMAALKLKRGR